MRFETRNYDSESRNQSFTIQDRGFWNNNKPAENVSCCSHLLQQIKLEKKLFELAPLYRGKLRESISIRRVFLPLRAIPAASEIAVLVFPTPPFCEAIAIIMVSIDESQNWVFRLTFYDYRIGNRGGVVNNKTHSAQPRVMNPPVW